MYSYKNKFTQLPIIRAATLLKEIEFLITY